MDATEAFFETWLANLKGSRQFKTKPTLQQTIHLAIFGRLDALLRGPPELAAFKTVLKKQGYRMQLSSLTWCADLDVMSALDSAWIHPKPEIGENKRYRTLSIWSHDECKS